MGATVTYARKGKWVAPGRVACSAWLGHHAQPGGPALRACNGCVLNFQTRHAAGIQQEMKMNRKERVAAWADKTGSTKADAERNIAALLEIIRSTLKKGARLP